MPIEHLIVLMLENRSFDHMLGFLDHPDPDLDRLAGTESNQWAPGAPPAVVSPTATYQAYPDPAHDHESVMRQLTGLPDLGAAVPINNSGFAWDYGLTSALHGLSAAHASEIMKCQKPQNIPVLAGLAREFAVCDRWFCSVPGQTWPNRSFAIAATSDGQVNIKLKPYFNKTIFDLLDAGDRSWGVYHDGATQIWAFPRVWARYRRRNFQSIQRLITEIHAESLPSFCFVEPDHFGRDSNSQHPGNNASVGRDFLAAEELILSIYEALLDNPSVFEKTLFVVTYDEHGGFYDHVPPPRDPKYRDSERYAREGYEFNFDLLGPRVPAVLVSPLIPRGTIFSRILDHSAIVATARELFVPDAEPLTNRDESSDTFHDICSLDAPRDIYALPDSPTAEVAPMPDKSLYTAVNAMDEFQASLLWLTQHVEKALQQEAMGGPEAVNKGMWWDGSISPPRDLEDVRHADVYQDHVVELFRKSVL